MSDIPGDITLLIRASASGEVTDTNRLMVAIYDDLRRLAASHLKQERSDHTLHPTALVHEAYIRLVNQRTAQWNDRLHFFSIASRIIRRILIDYARERQAAKRGGMQRAVAIEQFDVAAPQRELDLVALDEALSELAELDERQARIVELRFFGGLSIPEISAALSIGRRTVDREWQVARVWLYHRLSEFETERVDGVGA
ncbi:MAG TPA: ECF-type sigma factor [Phycisphaerales bacterium]|nr:ECF-type sigma factor [Phycisphaerales bacterium]HRQ74777.1 ECF-type sigma factor [Phycisphaerales bacterium]